MHDDIKKTSQEKMKKTINVLKKDLAGLRAGRANPQILDRIMVDYYGVPTPLNQLGSISAPEPRLLVISPWDTNALKDIEKAILKSDLGINPNNDGKVIRLVMPELTEERRKELTKVVRKKGEEAKVAIRSIRRDANDQYRKLKKDSKITEDELRIAEEEIQQLTDDHVKEIDKIVEAKEAEIMEV
ncbi:MAG TPA: ribosome recycling factor [Clostridiales bacterium]|nr:ribosome recycling factor [Clostridiales bacterium]